MFTLEQTFKDQSDLDSLCKERELKTNEICSWNAFYGLDLILKEYAGFDPDYKLKMLIPHGIVFSDKVSLYERYAKVTSVFNYSAHRQKPYKENTLKKIIPGNSPFLYVSDMLKTESEKMRSGTLFFLSHSTHHSITTPDFSSTIHNLKRLHEKYFPLTICIYWKDYQLGYHLPFVKEGFKVVSAGHIYDPNFLFRLFHLCSQYKYSSSNSIGSNLFYSIAAGCSFFYLEAGDSKYTYGLNADKGFYSSAFVNEVKEAFYDSEKTDITIRERLFNDYMGSHNVYSREEVKQKIEEAETFFKSLKGRVINFSIPVMRGIDKIRKNTGN